VEKEVPQTTEGSRKPPHNVVSLWDWIGSRDELVPLGRRAVDREAEQPPEDASPITFAMSETPPSADDFWGEGAAAIHDALQAPVQRCAPADAGSGAGVGEAEHARPARRRAGSVAQSLARRRAHVGIAAGLAAAAGLALAFTVIGAGTPTGSAGVGRVRVASILSDGMARILGLDLPLIETRPDPAHARVVRHRVLVTRRTKRPHSVSEPVRYSVSTSSGSATHPAVEASTARATQNGPSPSTSSDTSGRSASTSNASVAPVTPTGESGALGPIQSPNG
jgi:hypothetical protein